MPTFEQIRAHELRELRLMWLYFVGLMLVASVIVAGLVTAL